MKYRYNVNFGYCDSIKNYMTIDAKLSVPSGAQVRIVSHHPTVLIYLGLTIHFFLKPFWTPPTIKNTKHNGLIVNHFVINGVGKALGQKSMESKMHAVNPGIQS